MRPLGSKNKPNEIKQILLNHTDKIEHLILDVWEYGTMTEKLKLVQMILDRTVPKLQNIEISQDQQEEPEQNLTDLFLKMNKNDNTTPINHPIEK